jgi:O-antigen biosynthesis protein WbqP
MKRLFDITLALLLFLSLGIPMVSVALLVKMTSKGPALYWSDRIGKDNKIFKMPKFRTMMMGAPVVATHLLTVPDQYITSFGKILRKFSLDEMPQIFSVLKGDMSFVGPRPALYNQDDLIELRTKKGVHKLIPGITGWAQVNGRDDLPIPVKAEFDEYYLKHRSLAFDLRTLFLTCYRVIDRKGIQH